MCKCLVKHLVARASRGYSEIVARFLRQRGLAAVALTIAAGTLALAAPALAGAVVGYPSGVSFTGHSASTAPSGPKPEAKVWFNDGSWWGYLFDGGNGQSGDFHIFKLNTGTQTWIDTGVPVETRNNTTADVLWDGSKLYVASHVQSDGTTTGTGNNPASLYRFSYNAATDTYSLDAGFPAQIYNRRMETLTIAKDSTGQLWATWTEHTPNKVWINSTVCSPGCNDAAWGTAFSLNDAPFNYPALSSDDISSVIAFGGNRIGVMWSNQATSAMYFAIHNDADADNVWPVTPEAAISGSGLSDDHINLKADSAGRVFAATKTSKSSSGDPLNLLLVRTPGGSWVSHTFGTVANSHTRPIVLLDLANNLIRMYATVGQSGGRIAEKTLPLADADSTVAFPSGPGITFIDDGLTGINNATTTKQNVNASTGLVVLAANNDTDEYWHNYLPLAPDTTPPALTSAEVNGSTLTLTYNEPLNTTAPAPSVYTPGAGSVAFTATNVSITGSTVTVTINPAATAGQTVTLDYTVPGTNPVQDLAGNDAAALDNQPVTNVTGGGGGTIALAGSAISASIVSGSTVSLPSWTPAANDLILLSVAQRDESRAISVSGNGLTWTQIANVDNVQGQGGIALWRAQGASPTTGQITVTIAGNTLPVVATAQRFSGVSAATPIEATATNPGPGTDDNDMLHSVTTATAGAWAVAAGWNRTGGVFTVPSGENPILVNQVAGTSGNITRSHMWYQGPIASPGSIQLGATNDLSTSLNDWAMIVVSLKPSGGGGSDTTPPALQTATVNGATMTLSYDEPLNTTAPAPSVYTPGAGSVAFTATNVSITGSTVTVTINPAATAGQTVTLDYTVPGTNPVQDLAGNDAAALNDRPVTNNTPPTDVTPPALTSATVNGATMTLSYDEPLNTTAPAPSVYTPGAGSVAFTATNVSITGSTVTVTINPAATAGQTVTLDYTVPGTNPVQDLAGNDAAALNDRPVTNNTPPPGSGIALAGSAITASIVSGSTVSLPSWTPAANDLILLSVAQRDESIPISVSGNGLAWTEIANVDNVQGQGGISLWRAQGASPTTGQITVTVTGNANPVVVIAQRFSGVTTATPVEATATTPGPVTDDGNMLHSVTTATAGAWAVAAGWNRTSGIFSVPSGEASILINQAAGSSGAVTRSHMWYQGPVAGPASTQLGANGDLTGSNDWAMIVVSLKPS